MALREQRSGVWTFSSGSGSKAERFPIDFESERSEQSWVFDGFFAQKGDQVEAGGAIRRFCATWEEAGKESGGPGPKANNAASSSAL